MILLILDPPQVPADLSSRGPRRGGDIELMVASGRPRYAHVVALIGAQTSTCDSDAPPPQIVVGRRRGGERAQHFLPTHIFSLSLLTHFFRPPPTTTLLHGTVLLGVHRKAWSSDHERAVRRRFCPPACVAVDFPRKLQASRRHVSSLHTHYVWPTG